jgi:hypothetical protein
MFIFYWVFVYEQCRSNPNENAIMSNELPVILPPEGDYSLKGICLPIFRAVRGMGTALTEDLPDFLSECAQEIGAAWEESKEDHHA